MGNYDVVIVGGGMVGLTLALALQSSGLTVAVIDNEDGGTPVSGEPQLRVSAISYASQKILQHVGAWPAIIAQRAQPYDQMQVWEQDSFGRIDFSAEQVNLPQLGHIIENQVIRSALWQQAQASSHVTLLAPAKIRKLMLSEKQAIITMADDSMLTANLIVGADGANSFIRQQANLPMTFWDYDHTAIVATIRTQQPHNNRARQIFTPHGPLAFLPLWEPDLCSIVWSQDSSQARALLTLDEKGFSHSLTAAFDGQLGICELVSERQSFPLKMRYVRQWVSERAVVIGDAAHTIHPLAGQGVNLGLADAASLAETLIGLHQEQKDIGSTENLQAFERWRKTEACKMIATMEGFKRLFSGSHPLKKLLRDVGMSAMNHMPMAKDKMIRQAMGLEGELPMMAKSAD